MVEVETWCETLRKYPLRFKFEGLGGYHTSVAKAAASDEWYCERYRDREIKYIEENIGDFLDSYIEFLTSKLRLKTCSEELLKIARTPSYTPEELAALEAELGEHRYEFACDQVDWRDIVEDIKDTDPEYILEEYPPEEVWNEAYGMGFPIDHVVYMCPSCHRQAMTTDELQDNGHHHYCSLCGSEYVDQHDFAQPADLQEFCRTLEVSLWPFGHSMPAGTRVWWMDFDGSRSDWYTVATENGGTLVLTNGTEVKKSECIPEDMLEELKKA